MSAKITELESRTIVQSTDLFVLADADEGKNYNVTLDNLASAIGSSGSPTQHNALLGLQGGTTDEYYHLTAAEKANLGNSVSGSIPFYLSSGIKDNLPLLNGTALPFFLTNGVQDNIEIEV